MVIRFLKAKNGGGGGGGHSPVNGKQLQMRREGARTTRRARAHPHAHAPRCARAPPILVDERGKEKERPKIIEDV